MPKKSKTTESTTEPVQAAPVAPIAEKVVAAPKKRAAAAKKDVVAPVVVAPTTTENVVVDVKVVTDPTGLTENFSEFMAKFQALVSSMSALKTEFRSLEKKATRELKAAAKAQSKRKKKASNRQPSGFVKPTLISNELAKFLNKPLGSEMARTEVTREINGYIRANNLQDKENGRRIIPDKSLTTLLKIKAGEELTYFNLQRYMSPHFAKAVAKVAAIPVVAVTA
jgi:chromatin remodeling complex protein RSC6